MLDARKGAQRRAFRETGGDLHAQGANQPETTGDAAVVVRRLAIRLRHDGPVSATVGAAGGAVGGGTAAGGEGEVGEVDAGEAETAGVDAGGPEPGAAAAGGGAVPGKAAAAGGEPDGAAPAGAETGGFTLRQSSTERPVIAST